MNKKLTKIKEMNEKDIKTFVNEKKAKLADFRFNLSSGKMKNVKEGMALRKEIAQALTVLSSMNK
jgi:ribosomal protein L29